MKKLSLAVVLLSCALAVFAQKGKVNLANASLNENDLDNAKLMIDEALANEKSAAWPKTYVIAGKVYSKLQVAKKDSMGMVKAIEYFDKAMKLDGKGDAKGKNVNKYQKDIKTGLTFLKPDLINVGIEGFNEKNYIKAMTAFEAKIKLDRLGIFKEDNLPADTVIIYNCALAAYNAEVWDKAEMYFNDALDLGYGGGDVVLLINEVHTQTADSTKMEANLKKGISIYPEDDRILTYLIQFYLDSDNSKEAITYLETAIAKDPSNALYYSALGELYEKLDKTKAVESYEKALEVNPEHFGSLYNLGALFFNMGVEQQGVANSKKSDKEYQAGMVLANAEWKKSIPYMERALAVAPNDNDKLAVLDILKGLYYRFMNSDSSFKSKYEEVNAKIKEIEAK